MAKIKHKLCLTLNWLIPHDLQSPFTKYMGSALLNELHNLKLQYKEAGMRYHTCNDIVTSEGIGTQVDIIFDTYTERGENMFAGRETYRRDYNQLVLVLHKIDQIIYEIPGVCKPSAVLSTKNYKSPIIQVGSPGVEVIIIRDDYVMQEVTDLGNMTKIDAYQTSDGIEIKIAGIRVVGERKMVRKVRRQLEGFGRMAGDRSQLVAALDALYSERENSNWAVIVETADGRKTVYAFAFKTRRVIYGSTMDRTAQTFLAIKHKYPEFGIFGHDLKQLDL